MSDSDSAAAPKMPKSSTGRTIRGRGLQNLKRANGEPAAFGSLRFPSSARPPAKWAAVSSTSDMVSLVDVLMVTWRLPPPRVLISVSGAASGSLVSWSKKQQLIFRRGLQKVGPAVPMLSQHTSVDLVILVAGS